MTRLRRGRGFWLASKRHCLGGSPEARAVLRVLRQLEEEWGSLPREGVDLPVRIAPRSDSMWMRAAGSSGLAVYYFLGKETINLYTVAPVSGWEAD